MTQLASAILETTREAGRMLEAAPATSSMGRVFFKESPRATFVKNVHLIWLDGLQKK